METKTSEKWNAYFWDNVISDTFRRNLNHWIDSKHVKLDISLQGLNDVSEDDLVDHTDELREAFSIIENLFTLYTKRVLSQTRTINIHLKTNLEKLDPVVSIDGIIIDTFWDDMLYVKTLSKLLFLVDNNYAIKVFLEDDFGRTIEFKTEGAGIPLHFLIKGDKLWLITHSHSTSDKFLKTLNIETYNDMMKGVFGQLKFSVGSP